MPCLCVEEWKLYVEVLGFQNYTDTNISIDLYPEPTIPTECIEMKSSQQKLTFPISYEGEVDYEYYGDLCYYVKIPKNAWSYTASTSDTANILLYTGVGFPAAWNSATCVSGSYTGEAECKGNIDGADNIFFFLEAFATYQNPTLSIDFESKPGKAYKFSTVKDTITKKIEMKENEGTPADSKMRKALRKK